MEQRLFQTIPRSRASSLVAEHIQAAILQGRLRPGARLPTERDLAAQFGVSRLSVREALRILESRGLVSVAVGAKGGVTVGRPDPSLIRDSLAAMVAQEFIHPLDLAEARKVLEVATAGLAAARATEEDRRAMRAAVERTAEALAGDPAKYVEASVAFHLAVARASHNRALELTLASLRAALEMAFTEIRSLPDSPHRAYRDHLAILEAVERRDEEAARRIMADHMADFEARVRRILGPAGAPGDASAP
jgi:GntR family transcriptional repressor for pyruvate dehydrogenase complex